MKTFATNGTGSQQTLTELDSEKIPVYEDLADAESDLANLAENQIIATHDTGSELSAPVDVVQSGNMHAVTSNAVAGIFGNAIDNTKFALSTTGGTNVTAQCTGLLYVQFEKADASTTMIYEDDTVLFGSDLYISGLAYYISFTILIRKGHQYKWLQAGVNSIRVQNFIPFFD